ncbi:LOW QUALITY PROTEIN: cytosolic beta-glucosidase-like [Ciconia maguari]
MSANEARISIASHNAVYFACPLQLVPEDIAFPVGFAWGAATAAYQIEEGWNADGKGPNVWDTFTHQGGDQVFKNQTGDVACGSYTLWEEDLKCIKQLGLTHYRFSLSWSRLLPDGTTGFINQKGVNYYSKIINNLGNGILLTYHFDLPQSLEDKGGWRSEKIIETFDIHMGLSGLFTDGEYPAVTKSWISAMNSQQGYLSSRLLEFTKEEKMMIMDIADFFALNVKLNQENADKRLSVSVDCEAEQMTDPSWPVATGSLCLAVVPWGLHLLCYIKDTYNNSIIYISEKGFSQSDPALLDDSQWEYFRLILQEILKDTRQQNGTWMLRRLLLQTRRLPRIPTMAVLHHRVSTASGLAGAIRRRCRHTSPSIMDSKLRFYKVFGQKYVCISQPAQLLIRCFREQRCVAGPALRIPGAVLAHRCPRRRLTAAPLPAAQPTARSSLNLHQDPCCSNESHAEGFPQAGFIELYYRKYSSGSPTAAKTICHF